MWKEEYPYGAFLLAIAFDLKKLWMKRDKGRFERIYPRFWLLN